MEIRGRRTVFALLRLRELCLYLMYSGLCIRARNGRNRGQGRGCFRKSHSQRPKIVSFLNSRAAWRGGRVGEERHGAAWRGGTAQLHNSCIQNRANHLDAGPNGGCAGPNGGCAPPNGGCAAPNGGSAGPLQRLYFLFFHSLVISSRVLPLVSGTRRQTKRAARTHITP